MAQGSVTFSGLAEVKRDVEALPRNVTLALRAVAWRASRRVHASAQRHLRAKTHGTGQTADALGVVEDAPMKMFRVEVGPVPRRPANLPLWLELGTVKMSARAFLRPALEEAHADYVRESEEAALAVAREALT